ncbi:MAG: SDR family oxidoreductase [Roseivirga sp.]
MDLKLSDKIFMVTGGVSGIGLAISQGLVAEGAIPVIVDKNGAAGTRLGEDLKVRGHKALFIEADLCDTEQCRKAVEQTQNAFGELHGLINNAGVNDGVGLEQGSPEGFRTSLQKNLNHIYDLTHFCLPLLKETKGTILNIASKTALTGQGNTSGYAAAKGGVLALTREWAVELLKYQIRVNAIVPAEVMTPLYQKWLQTFDDPAAKEKAITDRIPLENRMTTPEEIANTALFLISGMAGHITGQHIHVDGGYTHLDRII